MKQLYSLLLTFCIVISANAQSTYRYVFANGMNEIFYKGPALTSACSGTYSWEALPAGASKNVYRFDKGCGLVFDDATKNFLSSGSYTIELYFKLDTITGYKKIIDYDSLNVDAGFYNQNGNLVLYNKLTTADSFVGADEYIYVAVTRDGSTKDMYVYANNTVAGTVNDANDQYMYGTDKKLIFFEDDNGTGGEQTGGKVALIQISDYAMDSNTIKSNYTNLSKTLSTEHIEVDEHISLYPNPATDILHIKSSVKLEGILYDVTGKTLMRQTLNKGQNNLMISELSPGVYLLEAKNEDSGDTHIYKIVKQ